MDLPNFLNEKKEKKTQLERHENQPLSKDRLGMLTGSTCKVVMYKNAKTKGYDDLVFNKAMERYYQIKDTNNLSSKEIKIGKDCEPLAKVNFEKKLGLEIQEVDYKKYNDYIGGSVDGIIIHPDGSRSLYEAKCTAIAKIHTKRMSGEIEKGYFYQMQLYMLVHDLPKAYFNSQFITKDMHELSDAPWDFGEDNNITLIVDRCEETIEKIKYRAKQFNQDVENLVLQFKVGKKKFL